MRPMRWRSRWTRSKAIPGSCRPIPAIPTRKRVWAMIRARREALAWMRALEINTPQSYWTYLRRYPNGMYAFDAERRLRRLGVAVRAAAGLRHDGVRRRADGAGRRAGGIRGGVSGRPAAAARPLWRAAPGLSCEPAAAAARGGGGGAGSRILPALAIAIPLVAALGSRAAARFGAGCARCWRRQSSGRRRIARRQSATRRRPRPSALRQSGCCARPLHTARDTERRDCAEHCHAQLHAECHCADGAGRQSSAGLGSGGTRPPGVAGRPPAAARWRSRAGTAAPGCCTECRVTPNAAAPNSATPSSATPSTARRAARRQRGPAAPGFRRPPGGGPPPGIANRTPPGAPPATPPGRAQFGCASFDQSAPPPAAGRPPGRPPGPPPGIANRTPPSAAPPQSGAPPAAASGTAAAAGEAAAAATSPAAAAAVARPTPPVAAPRGRRRPSPPPRPAPPPPQAAARPPAPPPPRPAAAPPPKPPACPPGKTLKVVNGRRPAPNTCAKQTPRRSDPARRFISIDDGSVRQRLDGCFSTGAPFGRSYWPGGMVSKNSSTSEVFTTSAYLAFMSHRLMAWLACERSKQPSSASEMR